MGGQISSQNSTGNWRWGLIKGYVDFYPFLSACVSSLFSFALLAFRPDYAFIFFFYFLNLFSTAKFCSGSVRATCYFASLIDDTPGDGKSDWFPWLISFGFFFLYRYVCTFGLRIHGVPFTFRLFSIMTWCFATGLKCEWKPIEKHPKD